MKGMSLSNSLRIHPVLFEVQRPVLRLRHLMTQGLVIKQNAQPPAEPVRDFLGAFPLPPVSCNYPEQGAKCLCSFFLVLVEP